MEKLEEQFITSCETALSKEGKEICKEVDSILGDNHKLLVEKANAYCYFCTYKKRDDIDEKLVKRCINYLDDMSKYSKIKNVIEYNSRTRKMV